MLAAESADSPASGRARSLARPTHLPTPSIRPAPAPHVYASYAPLPKQASPRRIFFSMSWGKLKSSGSLGKKQESAKVRRASNPFPHRPFPANRHSIPHPNQTRLAPLNPAFRPMLPDHFRNLSRLSNGVPTLSRG